MALVNFGKLQRVTDIRKYWPREDTDFTPWLGSEENIAILSDAVGMELEVQKQEANVGPFRADILCKNTADNSVVLIENQFGKTDHSHLGQLFTYAAGLDAVSLIWIVEKFTEEHRAAIDWLNKITEERFHFFGIEIELWTIGESAPAPKFNIVSKPNDWVKTVREATESRNRSDLTEWQQMQYEFWQGYGAYLNECNSEFKSPKPSASLWVGYGVGRSDAGLIVSFTQKEAVVYIQLDNTKQPEWFGQLHDQRESIEAQIGDVITEELFWRQRDGFKQAHIGVSNEFIVTDRANWPTIFAWMESRMACLKATFSPRIKAL